MSDTGRGDAIAIDLSASEQGWKEGLAIAEEAQVPFNMTFYTGQEGREVGKFYYDPETNRLCFEGDLDASGDLFIEHVLGQFREMYEKHQGDAS